eukprot:SAG11_NODE_1091_length_5910_cov_4.332817_6_plen_46_part_00
MTEAAEVEAAATVAAEARVVLQMKSAIESKPIRVLSRALGLTNDG